MIEPLFLRLERAPSVIAAMTAVVSDEDARLKPPSGAWSILEIVCHLVDEETDDFRARISLTQVDPAAPWPGIDPEGWAARREYQKQDIGAKVRMFAEERASSVAWLRSLREPDWHVAHNHPRIGPIRAGDLLCAWAAHDALHMRQIAKRLYELAARDGETLGRATGGSPFVTRYAGEWGA
ncbi:MAG: DinB family protein [Phycisphaeraceae bacterium]|nr:DinB family protein [Phycisphaeraceae bacterium]